MRHPFPGPGIAIRIIGEVTPERVQIARKADNVSRDFVPEEATQPNANLLIKDLHLHDQEGRHLQRGQSPTDLTAYSCPRLTNHGL
jgi:hypothetical protein